MPEWAFGDERTRGESHFTYANWGKSLTPCTPDAHQQRSRSCAAINRLLFGNITRPNPSLAVPFGQKASLPVAQGVKLFGQMA
jgi:hypothetical protein